LIGGAGLFEMRHQPQRFQMLGRDAEGFCARNQPQALFGHASHSKTVSGVFDSGHCKASTVDIAR